MGMRIGSAPAAGAAQGTGFANIQQRQQGFKDLFAALQSGNLASAQKAYASITDGKGTINPNSAMGKIGQALQAGDLQTAQQAAQALQAQHAGGHHHRHAATQDGTSGGANSATSGTGGTGPGSLVNLTA